MMIILWSHDQSEGWKQNIEHEMEDSGAGVFLWILQNF